LPFRTPAVSVRFPEYVIGEFISTVSVEFTTSVRLLPNVNVPAFVTDCFALPFKVRFAADAGENPSVAPFETEIFPESDIAPVNVIIQVPAVAVIPCAVNVPPPDIFVLFAVALFKTMFANVRLLNDGAPEASWLYVDPD
jgi:hypothetical protein